MADELLLTVRETARRLGVGRSTMYTMLREGAIPSVKLGALRKVRVCDLLVFVEQLNDTPYGDGF